ncbi:hypothetical protein C922_05402 [Plasmodium inui San Antonio 1]|uniref:Uncharacterized protein n=1 Tax=Plasmodium inui San Antonio 1 TaxID=1237626 RepID=W6ZY32_9APIC|nr:hypothetical protein C922_05402 [Plasmodium inui San Antonio 1]EUD64223.1 hypothetical protein C922_05402 [Plasmodium inui San Antonio 1]
MSWESSVPLIRQDAESSNHSSEGRRNPNNPLKNEQVSKGITRNHPKTIGGDLGEHEQLPEEIVTIKGGKRRRLTILRSRRCPVNFCKEQESQRVRIKGKPRNQKKLKPRKDNVKEAIYLLLETGSTDLFESKEENSYESSYVT